MRALYSRVLFDFESHPSPGLRPTSPGGRDEKTRSADVSGYDKTISTGSLAVKLASMTSEIIVRAGKRLLRKPMTKTGLENAGK
ncbi:MAG: hypothetical protein ACKVT0_03560 [Planctomycetaceae bacterium]